MNKANPELLAAYWTLAGDVYPGAPTEVSPFSLQERAAAGSKAGYSGMGIVHADLMANAAKMGFPGIKTVLADNGISDGAHFLRKHYAAVQKPVHLITTWRRSA